MSIRVAAFLFVLTTACGGSTPSTGTDSGTTSGTDSGAAGMDGSIAPDTDGGNPGTDSGSTPGPDGSSSGVTQEQLCSDVFQRYCERLVECPDPHWTSVSECYSAFRPDCCGAGCARPRPDLTSGQIQQCVASISTAQCTALEDVLGASCYDLIWPES